MKQLKFSNTIYWILALIVLLMLGCSREADTPESHLARAKDYKKAANFPAAIIELKNVLQGAPDNADARRLLGTLYLDIGDGASADKELRRAVELGVPEDTLRVELARAQLYQGKFDEVLTLCRNVESYRPDKQAALIVLRGDALRGLKQTDKAAAAYAEALRLQPGLADAVLGQAYLALAANKLDEARKIALRLTQDQSGYASGWSLLGDVERYASNAEASAQAYTKAIEAGRDNPNDRVNRVMAWIYLGRTADATKEIDLLRKRIPNSPLPHYLAGLLQLTQKHYVEAQSSLELAVSKAENFAPANFYLGVVNILQGNLEQADHYLSVSYAKLKFNANVRKALAMVRLRTGHPAEAEEIIRPVLAANPNDLFAMNVMAHARLAQGDTKQGIEFLQKVATGSKGSAGAQMNLAIGLFMAGDQTQGAKALENAIQINPQFEQADVLLISQYLKAHAFDKALTAAQQYEKKRAKDPLPVTLQGLAYLGKGDAAAAKAAFERALTIAPGDPGASLNLAQDALQAGNLDKARAYYQDVLRKHPDHLDSLMLLAALERRAGRGNEARHWLEQAAKAHPEEPMPRLELARLELDFGDPGHALTLLNGLPESVRKQPLSLVLVGQTRLAMGDTANAIGSFKQLVALTPRSPQAHYLLSEAYAEAGDIANHDVALRQALQLDPGFLPARITLVRSLVLRKKVGEAQARLKELRDQYPKRPEILALDGWVKLHTGQARAAVETYRAALAQTPSSSWNMDLSRALWQVGDKDAAVKNLQAWLTTYPGDVQSHRALADTYLRLQRPVEARAAYASLLEHSPGNLLALNNLAELYREVDTNKALDYAEQALRIAPDSAPILDTVAMIRLQQGEHAKALELLQKAVNLAPQLKSVRLHLAQAQVKAGQSAEARQTLQRLLADGKPFPQQSEARTLLDSLAKR
jgi:putative PEP-CTERM system TPR-repeat lipoprotein